VCGLGCKKESSVRSLMTDIELGSYRGARIDLDSFLVRLPSTTTQ